MPVTLTKTVYLFDELTDDAKEKARAWWRDCENTDFDADYDHFTACAKLLGVTFDQRPIKMMNGGTRYEPAIYWSGFSSQGDGACFEGRYAYAKGAPAAIAKYTGNTDGELIRIARELQEAQKRNRYQLTATTAHRGHYFHSGCMSVDVDADTDRDIGPAAETIQEALRDFANWIYRQLEKEYEWRMADEQVDDAITANEYTFDADGRQEG